ncbi:MAG: S8 family serine peptidase, partial [Acidimicrobiales bacterium]|nr:S8 family serine peptidase [Acidimicrobiales bacterium]
MARNVLASRSTRGFLPIAVITVVAATTVGVFTTSIASAAERQSLIDTSPLPPQRVVPVDPQVLNEASRGASVNVIVEFATPSPATATSAGEAASRRAAARAAGDRIIGRLPRQDRSHEQRAEHFPLLALTVTPAGLTALQSAPDVARIYANRAAAPSLDDSVPLIGGTHAYDLGYTGAGQTVAILDTGVDATHPFLAGKVVAEACFSTSMGTEIEAICPGADPTMAVGPGTGAPCPLGSKCDHGTHVAGIAAGNNGVFSGVAKDATIISVQVFSKFNSGCDPEAPPCVRVMDFDIIRGLDFVYGLRDTYSIASVNLSLGGFPIPGYCDFDSRKPAIDALRAAGIATVIASGNDSAKNGIQLPACISSAISVGATTKGDTVAGFSDSAPHLSLLAPGVGITSSVPGGLFATLSGTSMATPHVSGAIAILKQRWPQLGVGEAVGILRGTGLPVLDPGNNLAVPRIRLDGALEPPTFHPLTPRRLLDTRDGTGVAGGASAPIGPNSSIDLAVNGIGGVPADGVTAVVLNVTAVGASAGTHLTVWPARFPKPETSNLNVRAGETRAN